MIFRTLPFSTRETEKVSGMTFVGKEGVMTCILYYPLASLSSGRKFIFLSGREGMVSSTRENGEKGEFIAAIG